jgi:hypothetical protein
MIMMALPPPAPVTSVSPFVIRSASIFPAVRASIDAE